MLPSVLLLILLCLFLLLFLLLVLLLHHLLFLSLILVLLPFLLPLLLFFFSLILQVPFYVSVAVDVFLESDDKVRAERTGRPASSRLFRAAEISRGIAFYHFSCA